MFFKTLAMGESPTVTSPNSPRRMSIVDPDSPPRVILPRKCAPRPSQKSEIANLIQSLDFGLRPRLLRPHEPELPCTRPLGSSEPPSPFGMALDGPRSPSALNATWDLTKDDDLTETSLNQVLGTRRTSVVSRKHSLSKPPPLKIGRQSVSEETGYGAWADRFVSPLTIMISQYLPHLRELSLCGCHINGNDFSVMIENLDSLERLDVSYSTLKSTALECIARYCRYKLVWLNVSGIFKFGRNRANTLVLISTFCTALQEVVAMDCPEIYRETLDECLAVSDNRISFRVDPYLLNI